MTASPKAVVHVTIERFFESIGSRKLDDLMSLNDQLDQTLARHATGWQRPSADEAVLATDPPWDENGSPMDWASALSDSVRDEIGLDCSVGIAATRFAARICSRIARPRGVLLWLSGYEDGLIASLPLEELDELTPKQLAMLRAGGADPRRDVVARVRRGAGDPGLAGVQADEPDPWARSHCRSRRGEPLVASRRSPGAASYPTSRAL